MNPETMEFQSTMFLPTSTVATGRLCPNQRRMPQIGSLFAEIISMAVLIIRLPVVVLVSSPVLVQLLTGPCYLDTKSHSLLMNCGQELFSLEEFFDSAYQCNAHFWRIFAIVGNFLEPGFAQTFLNGMTAIGENSGVSSFMPGIIGMFSKVSENNPTEGVEGVQDLTTGGRFGPTAIFMKFSVNPIALTHWIWRMASQIVVHIIEATQKKRSVGSVFWNVIYDGRVDYKDLVAKRMYNTCGGFALMAGYTNPLGNTILHYCFAGVKSTVATLDLVSVFLVDLPLIVCVCRQTAGNNPANWILHHCDSPDGLKPLLRTLIDSPDTCASLVEQTNAKITGVFDDTLGELFAGTTSVGSILDSLLAVVDGGKAGQCDNFDSNPYVVTLIPEPSDYWRVCGKTDLCRLRCQQQIEAFEAVKPDPRHAIRATTSTQTVQSLFFPTLNEDAYNPFNSVDALNELDSCIGLCPEAADRCFLTAGFVGTNGVLRVAQFCVPSALAQGVSKGGQWDTLGISGLATDIQIIRMANDGWLDAYGVVGMQDHLVQICLRLECSEFKPVDVDPDALGFEQMQVIGDVGVFQMRTQSQGMTSYCLQFQSTSSVTSGSWSFNSCPDTNIWDQGLYYTVLSAKGEVLLLPFDNVPLQICRLNKATVSMEHCVQYQGFNFQTVPYKTKGLRSKVSQFMSRDYHVFIASNKPNNWLSMLSVSTQSNSARAMVGNSMSVRMQYTVQQGCSLDSCIGCTRLAVQRLCFAAQQCQVARCVGSQVNQLRPLCAIGGAVEAQLFTVLAGSQGIWRMLSATLTVVMDAAGGINPPSTINWPDQNFYGLICSQKDVLASMVSILTSSINGIIQASMPVTMMAYGDAVDNNFLATFSLTMMAITNFLYQMSLGLLYVAIAAQKVMICQTNSLVAVVSGNNAVTIGDPAIQTASSAATGVCMSQVHTENAQGLNSGMDNNKAFASGSTQILSKLGGLALELPLDALVHPIDVTFTYMLGVIRGLQDVLQTADQKKYVRYPRTERAACCPLRVACRTPSAPGRGAARPSHTYRPCASDPWTTAPRERARSVRCSDSRWGSWKTPLRAARRSSSAGPLALIFPRGRICLCPAPTPPRRCI
jgi:hypothetical protein